MESAVLGLADETSGQKIIAIIKLRKSAIDSKDLNGTYSWSTYGRLCVCVYMFMYVCVPVLLCLCVFLFDCLSIW